LLTRTTAERKGWRRGGRDRGHYLTNLHTDALPVAIFELVHEDEEKGVLLVRPEPTLLLLTLSRRKKARKRANHWVMVFLNPPTLLSSFTLSSTA